MVTLVKPKKHYNQNLFILLSPHYLGVSLYILYSRIDSMKKCQTVKCFNNTNNIYCSVCEFEYLPVPNEEGFFE